MPNVRTTNKHRANNESTRRTASNAIQRLVELGILEEITGYRRNRAFAARELIRAIEEPMDEAG